VSAARKPRPNEPAPAPCAIEVAAGLVFRDGRLLITQRPHDGHLGGLWEFPGGKRKADESFEACLRRELAEELGIEVEVKEIIETITHEYVEKTVHLRFFRCSLAGGEPRALGCPAFQWVGRSALDAFAFPAADARLLHKLKANRELWE
jgi:mutator protein MutT